MMLVLSQTMAKGKLRLYLDFWEFYHKIEKMHLIFRLGLSAPFWHKKIPEIAKQAELTQAEWVTAVTNT